MTQPERRIYLIRELLREHPGYADMEIPEKEQEQKYLLRFLFNIRMPKPVSEDFLQIQDAYLKEETKKKGGYGFFRFTVRTGSSVLMAGRHYHPAL